jgi:hypothetical protein
VAAPLSDSPGGNVNAFVRGVHERGECFARTDGGSVLADFQALDPARCEFASVRDAGRGGLRRARLGRHDAFIREYRRGGMFAGWLPAWRASPRRLLAELALSAELERRGIATPRALGGWSLRRGAGCELYLATVVVAGAQDVVDSLADGELARADAAVRRRAARALGRFVRGLHDSGLAHPDLQPRNLLVRGTAERAEFLVLDLDRARLAARLERAERSAQLARLWRWWVKRPAELARVRRGERAAFWIGYAPGAEGRAQRRQWLADAAASFRRAQVWHRVGWQHSSWRERSSRRA